MIAVHSVKLPRNDPPPKVSPDGNVELKVVSPDTSTKSSATNYDANGQVEMLLKLFIFFMVLIIIAVLWILLDENRDDPPD